LEKVQLPSPPGLDNRWLAAIDPTKDEMGLSFYLRRTMKASQIDTRIPALTLYVVFQKTQMKVQHFVQANSLLIGKPRSRFNVFRTSRKAPNKIKLHRRQFLGSQGVAESHLEPT
jgi:hypothetical protein